MNQELKKALKSAGNASKLAEATGIAQRTAYDSIERGYLSYEQAVKVSLAYGLDILALQARPADKSPPEPD